MDVGIIVQARMSSSRLKGKVLHDVRGKPLLQYLLEGLSLCKSVNKKVVATSTEKSDDSIANFCRKYNVDCYRGELNDVAGRFVDVLKRYRFNSFVRINGDSPLLDYRLIDKAVRIFQRGTYDIVTNVFPRTFPKGQSIEVLNSEIFMKSYSDFMEEEDFEHVTKFFYKNSKRFNICSFSSSVDLSSISLVIDTPGDLELFKKIIIQMKKPRSEYGLQEIIDLYRSITKELVS
jgi:spore coat polysaccharide biosynthesis protein SpsF